MRPARTRRTPRYGRASVTRSRLPFSRWAAHQAASSSRGPSSVQSRSSASIRSAIRCARAAVPWRRPRSTIAWITGPMRCRGTGRERGSPSALGGRSVPPLPGASGARGSAGPRPGRDGRPGPSRRAPRGRSGSPPRRGRETLGEHGGGPAGAPEGRSPRTPPGPARPGPGPDSGGPPRGPGPPPGRPAGGRPRRGLFVGGGRDPDGGAHAQQVEVGAEDVLGVRGGRAHRAAGRRGPRREPQGQRMPVVAGGERGGRDAVRLLGAFGLLGGEVGQPQGGRQPSGRGGAGGAGRPGARGRPRSPVLGAAGDDRAGRCSRGASRGWSASSRPAGGRAAAASPRGRRGPPGADVRRRRRAWRRAPGWPCPCRRGRPPR